MLGYRAYISAVDAHRTLVHIVKTHKERKERGLSASRCSDDTERSALWQRKAYIIYNFLRAAVVAEADMIENYALLCPARIFALGLYRKILGRQQHLFYAVCRRARL